MNQPKKYHPLILRTGVAIIALQATASFAHLPSYEGERVRNDNHFARSGFAQPVRGECDINVMPPNLQLANSGGYLTGALYVQDGF